MFIKLTAPECSPIYEYAWVPLKEWDSIELEAEKTGQYTFEVVVKGTHNGKPHRIIVWWSACYGDDEVEGFYETDGTRDQVLEAACEIFEKTIESGSSLLSFDKLSDVNFGE